MSNEYVPTIGLEIHAELKTQTKMFCNSKNDPDETRPNVNICPVCLAHPGALPVINREALAHVLKVGIALKGELADYTEFDRKNYFYPDLPKGYQLSQYEYPLVAGGELNGVAITRVHLEEDTASSVHDDESAETMIDFNRGGVPLMELVTEPVITSAEQAGEFARELQLLLRTIGASEANMEKGQMRVEANVSVGKNGERGTKVEIKNLNSFNAMERAVRYEIDRQIKLIEEGGRVVQETRGWDEGKQATFAQRIKEGSADYRYFPDPDLPSLKLSEIDEFKRSNLERQMPELPSERRARYLSLGIKEEDADVFIKNAILLRLFEGALKTFGEGNRGVALAANYLANDVANIIRDTDQRESEGRPEIGISERNFNTIIEMVRDSKISSRTAKDLLLIYSKGEEQDPAAYATEHGLLQESGSAKLDEIIAKVLKANENVVADVRAGKGPALEYLLGQCMRELRGAADPAILRTKLQEEIAKLG